MSDAKTDKAEPLAQTPASWLEMPRPEFPHAAQRAGVEAGRVVLTCHVLADGRISECSVEEDPAGVGFGPAALAAMKAARLKPSRAGGVAVDGEIRFTTRFRLSGPDDPPPAEHPAAPGR